MTEHYCCRDITALGMVSYPGWQEDPALGLPPTACGKVAHFFVKSGFPDLSGCWYCAECWDFFVEWNRNAGLPEPTC
jgi:hypothetical protein